MRDSSAVNDDGVWESPLLKLFFLGDVERIVGIPDSREDCRRDELSKNRLCSLEGGGFSLPVLAPLLGGVFDRDGIADLR